jgi:hypothetical protein
VQRFVDGGTASSRTIRQSREMLESLRAVDDVPAALLRDATVLARYARAATLAPNLGVLADGTQLAMELPTSTPPPA